MGLDNQAPGWPDAGYLRIMAGSDISFYVKIALMIEIIDSHCHFNQFPDWKSEIKDFKKLQNQYKAAFIPVIAAHRGNKSYEKQFRRLIKKAKSNPDLFLGVAFWVDVNNFKRSSLIAKLIPKTFLKLLKIQSSMDKISLKSKIYFKIVDLAFNLSLALYIHCTKVEEFVELDAVEKLVVYRPEVIKIIGHMGGAYPKNNKRVLEIMLKHQNTFMDTSSSMHEGTIEESVEMIGSKRLLFVQIFQYLTLINSTLL